jgi:hypothetical protein
MTHNNSRQPDINESTILSLNESERYSSSRWGICVFVNHLHTELNLFLCYFFLIDVTIGDPIF